MTNSAERSLFAIFVCISAMFLVCHFPRGILNILEFQGRIRGRDQDVDGDSFPSLYSMYFVCQSMFWLQIDENKLSDNDLGNEMLKLTSKTKEYRDTKT